MISHTSSISSSLGNSKNLFKEKDYDLIHYFDDQSDNEIQQEKHKNKNINKKTSIFKENDIYIRKLIFIRAQMIQMNSQKKIIFLLMMNLFMSLMKKLSKYLQMEILGK